MKMTLSAIGPRQFGRFNLVGFLTLYRREIARSIKDWKDALIERGVNSLLYLVVFSVAFDHIAAAPAGLSVAAFIAPGLAIYTASERAFEAMGFSVLFDKLEGMIADILMAPLTAFERVLAYILAAVTSGTITGIVVMAIGCVYVGAWPSAPFTALGYMVLSTALHGAMGLITGLFSLRWDHYSAIYSFLILPLSFLSGTFYAVASLPEAGRDLVSLNPIYYLIEGFRWAITGFGETQSPIGAAAALALIIVLGLTLIRLFARGVRLKP